jgi:hypothetical protein
MTEVSLPDSLRTMGEYAFSNCALLKSIEIPKGIEFIPVGTFLGI